MESRELFLGKRGRLDDEAILRWGRIERGEYWPRISNPKSCEDVLVNYASEIEFLEARIAELRQWSHDFDQVVVAA